MLKRIRRLLESAERVEVLEARLSEARQMLALSDERTEVRKEALHRIRYAVSAAPVNSLDHATQLLALIEQIAEAGYAGIPSGRTVVADDDGTRPLLAGAPSGVMAMAREQCKREYRVPPQSLQPDKAKPSHEEFFEKASTLDREAFDKWAADWGPRSRRTADELPEPVADQWADELIGTFDPDTPAWPPFKVPNQTSSYTAPPRVGHTADCAMHNAPAACDCGVGERNNG